MVPLNRWILAELPGTKDNRSDGWFLRPFRKFKGLLCEENNLAKKRMTC